MTGWTISWELNIFHDIGLTILGFIILWRVWRLEKQMKEKQT